MERKSDSEYAKKILDIAREELSCSYPFLSAAIYALKTVEDRESAIRYGLSQNADAFLYTPEALVKDFVEGKNIATVFLHCVLHCLFLHPFLAPFYRDKNLWDLSCDICVFDIIYAIKRDGDVTETESKALPFLARIKRKLPLLNAQWVYSSLKKGEDSSNLFYVDDHHLWSASGKIKLKEDSFLNGTPETLPIYDKEESLFVAQSKAGEALGGSESFKKWESIARKVELSLLRTLKSSAGRGDYTGYFLDVLKNIERRHTDFDAFLKSFGVYEEAPRLDPDSFDYSLYTYGLELYGDMPVIEPLEYGEHSSVREFAVAIDTSLSCPVELIRKFLEKTYDILFSSMAIGEQKRMVIFQCDCEIKSETVIANREDLKKYMSCVSVQGRGGTDFRPVFRRLEELNKEKFFSSLKGLLYFTDGDGIYPEKPPKYKTAFVIPYGGYMEKVPSWAMKVGIEA